MANSQVKGVMILNMRSVGICIFIGLLVVGCGRKEPPQFTLEQTPPPSIVALSHEQNYNSLKVTMRLAGGGGVLGYQVDRAQIDPICHCPTAWRQDYELQPRKEMDQHKVMRLITIHKSDIQFLYRVRAIDALGRLGPWSKTIRTIPVKKL